MRMGLVNNKGQAAAELAILGFLVLLAFSFVMNFGQTLGRTQQVKMESFRKALKNAYDKNGTVSYTLRKNSNLASVTSSFFQGQDSGAEGSYGVTWSKGESGPMGSTDEGTYSYWQINDSGPIEMETVKQYHYGPTGGKSDEEIKTPVSVYKVNETRTGRYTYNLRKEESNPGINYSKEANVIDSSAGTLYTRINTNIDTNPGDDNTPEPNYQTKGSKGFANEQVYTYAQGAGNIQRWYVPHGLEK